MSHFIRSDGHVTDVALSALADKEERVLDDAALAHLTACSLCLERLGLQASAQVQLEAQLVALSPAHGRMPWRLMAASTVMLAAGLLLAGTERIPSVHVLASLVVRVNRVYSATMGPGVLLACGALALACGAVMVQGAKMRSMRSQ